MTERCFEILVAVSVSIGALGLFFLCRSLARYFDRAAAPKNIALGIGVALKNLVKIRLDFHGEQIPDSKKDHPQSNDDGLPS